MSSLSRRTRSASLASVRSAVSAADCRASSRSAKEVSRLRSAAASASRAAVSFCRASRAWGKMEDATKKGIREQTNALKKIK
eukprot:1191598-Prorocentrum_minimum.AAC.2